jgi:predicted tellurium resistance membrane protein TerC
MELCRPMTEFFELFTQSSTYISLLTLTLMEIVLGVDNIVFISILAARLPENQQGRARNLGLGFALGTRILLLLSIAWIAGLINPLFTIFDHSVTGRDLILISGGIFLLAKSTMEIHGKLEGEESSTQGKGHISFWKIVFQIVLLDIVFSFDSVITAVGLVQNISIMIVAIILSMIVMLLSAESISSFIERHPTVKMLALSFLLMIGTLLVAEGFHIHVPKGYVYFAMAFSLFVEVLNIKLHAKTKPVKLRDDAGL